MRRKAGLPVNKVIALMLAVLAIAAVVGIGAGMYLHTAAPRPDIILITAHSLRPDHLSSYGYDRLKTGGLDSLANTGALFESAYTNIPSPAHGYASILCGKACASAGDIRSTSLSGCLKTLGYTTAAIVSDTSAVPPFDPGQAGFDVFETVADKAMPDKRLAADRTTTERALTTMRTLKESEKPFFAWISYAIPRYPYKLPDDFLKNPDDFPYDRQVLFLDEQVSNLLEGLKRMRLDRGALIIFTSATGESLGEHKEPEHGFFIYDATLRVPLMIKLPGGRRAARIKPLATHADILPTVLDVLKAPRIPAACDGKSLLPALKRDRTPERPVYLESLEGHRAFGWSPLAGIVSGGYKYIEAPAPELYNLADDPHELNNIIGNQPTKAAEMKSALMEYIGRKRQGLAARMNKGADPKDAIDVVVPYLIATRHYGDDNLHFLTGIYERLLEKDPKNKAIRYALARFYLRDSQYFSAEKMLLGLNEDYPDYDLAWQLLGETYNMQGRDDDAVICFERALALNPDLPASLNNTAWIYAKKGERLDTALQYAERAIALAGDTASFFDTLAEVYYRMGNTEKAREIIAQALALDKESEYLQKRVTEMEGERASPSGRTR